MSGCGLAIVYDVVDKLKACCPLSLVVWVAHAAKHLHAYLGIVGKRVENVERRLASCKRYLFDGIVRPALYGAAAGLGGSVS